MQPELFRHSSSTYARSYGAVCPHYSTDKNHPHFEFIDLESLKPLIAPPSFYVPAISHCHPRTLKEFSNLHEALFRLYWCVSYLSQTQSHLKGTPKEMHLQEKFLRAEIAHDKTLIERINADMRRRNSNFCP